MEIGAVITGSTGLVGERALLECLDHPEMEQVLVINRKPGGPMATGKFEQWLERYGRAWEMGSPESALDLFSEHAEYFETPFDPPMVGHGAIRRYWIDRCEECSKASQVLGPGDCL